MVFASACAAPVRMTQPQIPATPPPLAPMSMPMPMPMLRPVTPGGVAAPELPPAVMLSPVPIMLPPPTDAVSLRARYGAPDFIRRESDSELWRYDGANCAAFFFLYREGEALKIRYSETMPRGMEMAADPTCVESLSGRAGATS